MLYKIHLKDIFMIFVLFFILNFVSIGVAHATSPISQIGSPVVTKGELGIESRFGYTEDGNTPQDDNRVFTRQHFNYGFTDWYATRLIFRQNKFNNDAFEYNLVGFENHFQFTDRKIEGFDSGMRIVYIANHHNFGSDILENRYLLQLPIYDDWQYRFHGIFTYTLENNPNHDVNFEMRHQLTYRINMLPKYLHQTNIGLETFNFLNALDNSGNYQDQNHQLGTILRSNLNNNYYFQTHYRFGITDDSADKIFGISIGKKFDL